MNTNYEKLKKVLAEIFQLDQADLDFGIYRIMNQKRDEITRFLEKDLLPQVKDAFAQYRPADKAEIQRELDDAVRQAKNLGADPDDLPKVKELRTRYTASVDLTALEEEVFSHLANFFRRYYDKGDFISQRRYKEGVYAIPYEGEEVKLYWANHDQYYVKTSEYFRDYSFKLPSGRNVHFKIVEADTEKDNIKGTNNGERRFIVAAENPFYMNGSELVIRFEYRADPEKRTQKDLNVAALQAILQWDGLGDWGKELTILQPTEANPGRTLLERHLNDYTARNTFDYFIHKDLGEFLRQELDFYIKNEIMHLDDIENESAPRVEQYLSMIKAVRLIAHKIIAFLAQIEDFQRKLWLKKKFVVETNYCVTLDRVPEELYPEIVANDLQREEWVKLFAIDEIKGDLHMPAYSIPLTVEFLKANPFLVLDTRFFSDDFKNRFLASIDSIDEQMDGLLIPSENFQALNLLQERYGKQIQCIHIDPPYNTATSGFLYKNNYQHSSWLAMMEARINISTPLFAKNGAYQCHIDENEYEVLHQLFEYTNIPSSGTLVWDKKNPMLGRKGVATQHEYVIWRSSHDGPIYRKNTNVRMILTKAEEIIRKHGGVTEKARQEFGQWIASCGALSGGDKAYKYIDNEGKVYRLASLSAGTPSSDPRYYLPLNHPITKQPCPVPPTGWSRTPETFDRLIHNQLIIFGKDHTTLPQIKLFMTEDSRRQLSTVIQDASRGKNDAQDLGITFPYCHPVSLYEELLGAGLPNQKDIVLDYFAGSGTTGHAVINLNREDDGNRKYILVEMGDYFDTVLKPRIQKVIYSKDWKDGKPVSREGSSHMFKYIRLESYEDTLNNLELRRTEAQGTLLKESSSFRESYMLSYMLDVESKDSLLNLSVFEDPFKYTLKIATGSVGETAPVNVDLVETFNYLIGLTVQHIDHIQGYRVVQGRNPKGEKVLVIWRNVKEKSNEDLERFFRKQDYNPKDMEFAVIYVNGDNNLENIRRDDETWKVRLIEEEFKRLMFSAEGV